MSVAWLEAPRQGLVIKDAPALEPKADQIVVRNHAVAVSLVDWAIQDFGDKVFPWLTYPTVLGTDLAGEVVSVGPGVTKFLVGDRVVAATSGIYKNEPTQRAFRTHTVVDTKLAVRLPSFVGYEEASVLPLGVLTAVIGLFEANYLNLALPTVPAAASRNETVIVWSGSSSVGSNAVQLAVAAGYNVVSTASSRNFDYVKAHGASSVFDYRSETVINDIVAAVKGHKVVGILAIGTGDATAKSIALARGLATAGLGDVFVALVNQAPNDTEGVRSKFVLGSDLSDRVINGVLDQFLPQALAQKKYIISPEPKVVGKGLESLQAALDAGKGTTGAGGALSLPSSVKPHKIVVTL